MKWWLITVGVAAAAVLFTASPTQAGNAGSNAGIQVLAQTVPTDSHSVQLDQPRDANPLPDILEPVAGEPPKIYSPWTLLAVLAALALVAWAGITLVRNGLRSSPRSHRRRRRQRTA